MVAAVPCRLFPEIRLLSTTFSNGCSRSPQRIKNFSYAVCIYVCADDDRSSFCKYILYTCTCIYTVYNMLFFFLVLSSQHTKLAFHPSLRYITPLPLLLLFISSTVHHALIFWCAAASRGPWKFRSVADRSIDADRSVATMSHPP